MASGSRTLPEMVAPEITEPQGKLDAVLQRNRELGKGLKVGKTFKIQAEGGYAWYEVTRVGPDSADVEWRDYGLDRYMDEMLAAGGAFPRGVIERLVHHHDTLEELFGEPV